MDNVNPVTKWGKISILEIYKYIRFSIIIEYYYFIFCPTVCEKRAVAFRHRAKRRLPRAA